MENEWFPCGTEFVLIIGSQDSDAMNPSITSNGMLSSNVKLCIRLLPATMKLSTFQELLDKEGIHVPDQYRILYYVQGNLLYA